MGYLSAPCDHETRQSETRRHTLEERRVGADLIEVFKMVRELSAIRLETFFQLNNTGNTRGHKWKLKKRHCNTDLRQHFSERVMNRWNSLDKDTVAAVCGMVPRWRSLATFLPPAFAASHMQHLSDLHSKFALGPHHVSKYGRHPISDR